MIKKDLSTCTFFGVTALVAGCLCHKFAPGLGMVIMPMVWPLAVLATRVSMPKAVATAAIVPFVSTVITGMPAMPFVVSFKFAIATAAAALVWRACRRLRSR